jgi:hypothetical protein
MFLTVLVFLFYSVWGVLSLTCQGRHPLIQTIKARDVFGLLPNYKFFCPNPVRNDYHLYYRQRQGEDQWKEIPIPTRHPVFSMFWNPGKRERKVFTSAIHKINAKFKKRPENAKGPVYRFFLHYIAQYAGAVDSRSIQFKITTRQDLKEGSEETVIFISNVKTLTAAR